MAGQKKEFNPIGMIHEIEAKYGTSMAFVKTGVNQLNTAYALQAALEKNQTVKELTVEVKGFGFVFDTKAGLQSYINTLIKKGKKYIGMNGREALEHFDKIREEIDALVKEYDNEDKDQGKKGNE
jgi:hypothetical protein